MQRLAILETKVFEVFSCVVIPSCPAKSEGLVHYPTTLAPVSRSVTVTAQCADNAHQLSSTLSVFCTASSSWSGPIPQCHCNDGYRSLQNGHIEYCVGQ